MRRVNKALVTYDLLKLILIIWIIIFHVWFFLYGDDSWSHPVENSFYPFVEIFFAPYLNFVGIFLPSLAFYLHGLPKKEVRSKSVEFFKYAFLIVAVFAAQKPFLEFVRDPSQFIPTVYLFILASYVLVFITSKQKKLAGVYFVSSLILLMLPRAFWITCGEQLADPWRSIFFQTPGVGWSLFPWCLAPVSAFYFARLTHQMNKSLVLQDWALLAAGCFLMTQHSPSQMPAFGAGFNNFVFFQPPSYFMAHFFVFLFILRLSSLENNENFLKKTFIVYISRFYLVRYFWLCYLLQFDIYALFRLMKPWIESVPYGFDSLWIVTLGLLELYSRFVLSVFNFIMRKKGWAHRSSSVAQ